MTDEPNQIDGSLTPIPSYAIAKTSGKSSLARRGLLALAGSSINSPTDIAPKAKGLTATVKRTTIVICDNEQTTEVAFVSYTNRWDAKKAMRLEAAEINRDGFTIKYLSPDEYICLLGYPEGGYYEEIRLSLPHNTKAAKSKDRRTKAKQSEAEKSG